MNEGTPQQNGMFRPLLIALSITLGFGLVEVIGGILSGSLALLSDAGHMFTDVLALGLSLGAAVLTTKQPTKRHTFGFHRIEILVALVNGLTLAVLSILIIIEALNRFQQPSEVDSSLMLTVSLIGLGVNLVGMFVLRGRKDENLNVKGAYLHMMGDLLSSIGVIIAALLIQWFGFVLADPLISIFIGVVIIIGAYELVERSISILLEAVPSHIDIDEVERALLGLDGVAKVHDLHIWTLTSGIYAMSAHVIVQDRTVSSCDPLMREIYRMLKNKFQITHSTIQMESVTEEKCTIAD